MTLRVTNELVSIIMPTYNSMNTIKESIESILAQTYSDWELLITDDCSIDGTYEYLLAFSQMDGRVKVFRNVTNGGAGVSRNNSITYAQGRYIAFLDSDDLWHENKLLKQIDFMRCKKLALSYSGYQKMDMLGALGKVIIPPNKVNYSQLLKSNAIGCLTAVYDQTIVGKTFMPTIRKRQDMALWLEILKKTKYAECVPGVLAYYREGQVSLSSNKIKILFSQWSFYRDYLNFNFIQSLYYFSFYLVKAIIKHKG